MNEEKNEDRLLTEQEFDSPPITIGRILMIALVIVLGMLIASGILFNGVIVQSIVP